MFTIKNQVDTSLNSKANSTDVYTKTQIDTSLISKANITDVNTALALKATITDVNTALALKVNATSISNVANTAPSDLPVSTATISMIAGVNGQITSNILYLTQTKADIVNPTFTSNVDIWGGLNVTGTTNFYGPVTGIPIPSITSLSLFNVANTKPSDLPKSNAVTNALYQYAQLTNPFFNGVVAMQGLKLYGVAGASPIFDAGMIQHNNILKMCDYKRKYNAFRFGNKFHHRFNRYLHES